MSPKHSRGFTLIEVLVAMAIMAGLTLLTAQAIKSAIDNRSALSGDIARDSRLADALRILRNDVSKAFHHRDIQVALENAMYATPTPTPAPGGAAGAQTGMIPPAPPVGGFGAPLGAVPARTPRPTPPQVTAFWGEANALYFTSLSNVRVLRDSQESDQLKLGYFLRSCRSPDTRRAQTQNQSQCLIRTTSNILDEDIKKTGPETVLLENVIEFKLRYFAPDREEPAEQWRTGPNGDAATKENFPSAVEITLTTHNKNDPKDTPVTQTILVPIHFPNNPPKKKDPQAGGTGP